MANNDVRPHHTSTKKNAALAPVSKKRKKDSTTKTAYTIYDLYSDLLVSILDFGHPLEIWFQRLVCSRWHTFVPVALSRTVQVYPSWSIGFQFFSEQPVGTRGSRYIRRVVDLCPNLKFIRDNVSRANDVKYVLDHCTKLTEIYIGMTMNTLNSISPHHALQGHLVIREELSLEPLKAKLPKLNDVRIIRMPNKYVTKFCSYFPLLNKLEIWPKTNEVSDNEVLDNLSTAISSLQNLRTLELYFCNYLSSRSSRPTSFFTEDQVHRIIRNLTYLEEFALYEVTLSDQSFMCLAQMPRLRTLRINLETAHRNLPLFTNKNNFPELSHLTIRRRENNPENYSIPEQFLVDEVQTRLANHRPTLNVWELKRGSKN